MFQPPLLNLQSVLHFRWTLDHIISYCLIFPYLNPLPLSYADYIGLPHYLLLSLIPSIVNHPWCYLVALLLSLYQCPLPYPVRYIGSQSSGTVGLGLCPHRLVTLFARVLWRYINCTTILLGP